MDVIFKIVVELGVRVICQKRRGYGDVYIEGFKVVWGKYIVMLDLDGSYDFCEILKLLEFLLKDEVDFVIGIRFKGMIEFGVMLWFYWYIGNFFLIKVFNLFFKVGVFDVYCGFRVIKKEVLQRFFLKCCGMEFVSEMVIEVVKVGFRLGRCL